MLYVHIGKRSASTGIQVGQGIRLVQGSEDGVGTCVGNDHGRAHDWRNKCAKAAACGRTRDQRKSPLLNAYLPGPMPRLAMAKVRRASSQFDSQLLPCFIPLDLVQNTSARRSGRAPESVKHFCDGCVLTLEVGIGHGLLGVGDRHTAAAEHSAQRGACFPPPKCQSQARCERQLVRAEATRPRQQAISLAHSEHGVHLLGMAHRARRGEGAISLKRGALLARVHQL